MERARLVTRNILKSAAAPILPITLFCMLLLTACSKPEIVIYDAPKDPPRDPAASPFGPPAPSMMGAPAGAPHAARSPLVWVLPEGWHQVESTGARTAAFHAHAGAAVADVVLVEFPPATDAAVFYAHLARQVGQEPGDGGFAPVEVGPHSAQIAHLESPAGQGLLAALVPIGERLWLAQVTGTAAEVGAMRPSFEAFLGSLAPAASALPEGHPTLATGTAGQTAPTASPLPPGAAMVGEALPDAAVGRGATPTWVAPSHWGPGPASSMRRGSYRVDGAGGTTIDIAVTTFPGDVGGLLPNLNRWRQQIGLPPITHAELPTAASTIQVGGQQAIWADFTGSGARPQRTLVAQFQVGGESWFFKATGDATLVSSEEANIRAFVESVRFPNP